MKVRPLLDRAAKFLRRWDGRLTQELVLHPAQFGLGKVPARLKPDDVTSMICGFCSTGCSLECPFEERTSRQLDAEQRLSGQPRNGLPKGLGGIDTVKRSGSSHHAVAPGKPGKPGAN